MLPIVVIRRREVAFKHYSYCHVFIRGTLSDTTKVTPNVTNLIDRYDDFFSPVQPLLNSLGVVVLGCGVLVYLRKADYAVVIPHESFLWQRTKVLHLLRDHIVVDAKASCRSYLAGNFC